MNNNKLFGQTFIVILTAAMLFFGTANAGAYAVDTWLFPTQKFGENTYIGTTEVSDMALADAKLLFTGQTAVWRETAELHVTYQDATGKYPLENAEILLDETVGQAQSGTQNNFVYHLSPETTGMFLAEQFPVAQFTETDIATINTKLEQSLAAGQTQTRVTISDDLLGLEKEIIADVSFPHNLKSAGIAEVITAMQRVEIPAGSQFSFLDFISELNLTDVTDAELTEVASAIYTAVLKTNFSIEERSIGNAPPEMVPIGQEAAINRSLGIDLVFTNPNASSFDLAAAIEGNSLVISLSGYPLVYTYAIQIGSEEKVKPRLIKQYSAFVSSGKKVEAEGTEGVRIEVLRSILANGQELQVQPISSDFYPPVHRVEVYPLTRTETAATEGETGTTVAPQPGEAGFVDANGDGVHDAPAAPAEVPVQGEAGFVDSDGDGIHDAPAAPAKVPVQGEAGFVDTNGDGIHDGEPSIEQPANGQTDPATGETIREKTTTENRAPVYDKAGNLVYP
ncbi:VanW like protein [Planomicrobium soli]|uniref:VanW like protein n=1 Tax=Planomicrobium soli TaxID=1176648 RepID=A0A2P8GMG0_9BACL|nr:VanW family protein [Planomicrobium soli]PSL35150.1 VanW like protein [Planomicrobium soli]